VALDELAEDLREGLLALAVGVGLQVMTALMEQDVAAACGPRGKHDPQRSATRHGHGGGSVSLGGRRVPVTRPRMRATDGSGELPVIAYELLPHRGAGPDGDGTDVGRVVDAALPGRAGAGRRAHRAGCGEHLALGGLAPVSSPRPRPCWPSCWPATCRSWIWSRRPGGQVCGVIQA